MGINKGFRTTVVDNNSIDIHILGVGCEINSKYAPPIDKSKTNAYTLRLILDGSGFAIINGVEHELKKNMLFVTFPNNNVQLQQSSTNPYKLAWFIFEGSHASQYLSRININPQNLLLQLPDNKNIRKIFSNTTKQCLYNPKFSDTISLSAFYKIIYLVGEISHQTKSVPSSLNMLFIDLAMEYMNNNYHDSSLSLATIANHLGYSAKYLSKIFKKETGINITQYLNNKRTAVATDLLINTDLTIAEIAHRVGFSTPFYFSTTYKKIHYITPSEKRASTPRKI